MSSAWVPAIIFALGVVLLVPSVWSECSVTGQDEYSLSLRTPIEMLQRGDWLTPWLDGKPRLQKPPLLYWAILLNYKLFGIHLLSARIWGVLSGAGLAVCACLFSRQLFQRDGLLAGLLALATMGVAVEGRRAMLDLPAALFSTLAVLWFVKWSAGRGNVVRDACCVKTDHAPRTTLPLLLLAAVSLALSFLSKGPVGFLFFITGAIACAAFLQPTKFEARNWWQLLLALLLLAAICLPWPLAMRHIWSERFSKIMGEELTARQFGHWTPGSPFSAWSGALGLILPWTPMLLGAIYSHFRHASSNHVRETRFLIGWFVLAAVPFFFMKSFERYMLALVPAQIVLCAEWLEENPVGASNILLRLGVFLLVLISLVMCVFAWWFKLAAWQIVLVLLVTGTAVFLAARPTHPHWLTLVSALLFTVALGGLYPRFGINALPDNIAGEAAPYPVSLFNAPQPSLLSMRLGRSLQAFDLNLWDGPASPTRGMVFVEGTHRQEFLNLARQRQVHVEERGHFRTFYSRRAWIRFARPDATWEDWKLAFHERSLEQLKSEFYYYLVFPTAKSANA